MSDVCHTRNCPHGVTRVIVRHVSALPGRMAACMRGRMLACIVRRLDLVIKGIDLVSIWPLKERMDLVINNVSIWQVRVSIWCRFGH